MRQKGSLVAFSVAALLPGSLLFIAYQVLNVWSAWLFIYLGVVLTLAALLFAWTFSRWTAEPLRGSSRERRLHR
jgi:H+/Cl- antiporter ClcA